MGHIRGSTRHAVLEDGSRIDVTENYRRELLGKGICEAHVEAYFAHRRNSSLHNTLPRTMMARLEDAAPEQAELFLSSMDSTTRCKWFSEHTLAGFQKLMLKLKMDLTNGIPQTNVNYGQGGKLDQSMKYALNLMVQDGLLKRVQRSKDQMISPCFPKAKPGRTFPGTDLTLVRVLADLRNVNIKIIVDPDEWTEVNPTRDGVTFSVPHGTKWFGDVDLHDAFHHAPVHPDSQPYLVICWMGEYYMYTGCPQGIKVGSGHFMMLMINILNTAVGPAWSCTAPPAAAPTGSASSPLPFCQPWWIGYCDDWMPIGDTKQRAENRQNILLDILKVVKLPISPKCTNVVSQTGTLIGLHWTEHGHCLSDDAVDSLVSALQLIPKTTTDAKATIGLINYSESAFVYSPHEQARHGTLMTILNEAVTLGPRLNWSDDAQCAVKELSLRMQNLPRAYYDPVQLFSTGEFIIVILGDASKTGAGSSLYLVHKKRAEDFDKSDLTDSRTLLVDCYHKVLSKSQRKWQTYESESWIMVKSAKKWAKYISRALYTRSHWDCNKILMLSDSTTAAAKWYKILLPEYAIDSICAKARRFLSWADKVAYTSEWPLVTNHLPGEYNSLSHLLSHVGDLLTAMYENPPPDRPSRPISIGPKDQVAATPFTLPVDPPFDLQLLSNSDPATRLKTLKASTMFVSLHSYHGKRPEVCSQYDEPPNYTVHHLHVQVEAYDTIASAYTEDTNLFHKVTLQHIYAVATDNCPDMCAIAKRRIQSWLGKVIFPICPPGSSVPLLYTMASCTLVRWGDPAVIADDDRLDLTLVPIIPANCKVRLTNLTPISKDHDDSEHEQYRDLRHDILLASHGLVKPHNSVAHTLSNVKRMAYWPKLQQSVTYFCDTCSHCLSNRKSKENLGMTLQATRRLGSLMMDKLVLDKDLANMLGIPAVLIFTDPCIGDSFPAIVESMTAVEAARVIFCHAIPRYSIPYTIISDSEPAFASTVCQELARMMGIPEWDFGAVTSPQHHAKIEVRMKPYNDALQLAMNDGHIKCRRTLEIVLAQACIKHTQHVVTYGTTAFTRLTGAVPRTVNDLFSSPAIPQIDVKPLTESDKDVLDTLTLTVTDLCDWHQECRDVAHRSSLFSKLVKDASMRVTDFYMLPGDMVSYQGERWKLLGVLGPPNQPITAKIQQATHADAVRTKLVRYDTLQNLSAAREKLDVKVDLIVKVDDYVFFTNSDGLTCSGLVTSVTNDDILVHAHDPSPQLKSFLPNWIRGKLDKSQRKAPRGYSPDIIATTLPDIDVVTTLDAHGHIPTRALDELKSKGVTMPFEYLSDHLVHAHPVTVRSSGSPPLRPTRRDAFAITTLQHRWIVECITTLGVPPTNDPFLDHALLIHIMMNGKYSLPSGAKMDANIKEIKRRVQGFQADSECRTNQVFRIQFLIMAFPDTCWLRSAPATSRSLPRSPRNTPVRSQRSPHRQASPISPVTPIAASSPITARGQVMIAHAPATNGPAANTRSRGNMTPPSARSQPRTQPSPARKSNCRSPSPPQRTVSHVSQGKRKAPKSMQPRAQAPPRSHALGSPSVTVRGPLRTPGYRQQLLRASILLFAVIGAGFVFGKILQLLYLY